MAESPRSGSTSSDDGGEIASRTGMVVYFLSQAIGHLESFTEKTSGPRTASEEEALRLLLTARNHLGA